VVETQEGSDRSDVEVLGPKSLPSVHHGIQVGSLREPMAAREPVALGRNAQRDAAAWLTRDAYAPAYLLGS
jgi:hypothetical protein